MPSSDCFPRPQSFLSRSLLSQHQLQVFEISQARDTLQTTNDEITHLLAQHSQTEDELERVNVRLSVFEKMEGGATSELTTLFFFVRFFVLSQARSESEMASKLETMAKLRERVTELEREKRETDKRYSEQVSEGREGKPRVLLEGGGTSSRS